MESGGITSDPELKECVNTFDIPAPDVQPVRWALNWLHGVDLDAGAGAGVGISAVAGTAPAMVSLPGHEHQFIYKLVRAKLWGRQAGGQE